MGDRMTIFVKILKIAIGSTLAILVANALHLEYALAASVIALLSIQDTKKDTIQVAITRILFFFVALPIAYISFTLTKFSYWGFCLFLILFVAISYKFQGLHAIAINTVIATHYFAQKSMSFSLIINELGILLIGALIGILFNLYVPSNEKMIRKVQKNVEDEIRKILFSIEHQLTNQMPECDETCYVNLKSFIDEGLKQAYDNMNNSLFQERKYFIEYMQMRRQQYKMLKRIQDKVAQISKMPSQTTEIANFVVAIAESLAESQNAKELLKMQETLFLEFSQSKLPITRAEFEDRAILFVILMDFQGFLKLKEEFVDQLSEKEKDKYWKLR